MPALQRAEFLTFWWGCLHHCRQIVMCGGGREISRFILAGNVNTLSMFPIRCIEVLFQLIFVLRGVYMPHSIHLSPLTPIKTIEVGYGCYWTGHLFYGPSSSWSLTECICTDCEEVIPHWVICPVGLECTGLVRHHN